MMKWCYSSTTVVLSLLIISCTKSSDDYAISTPSNYVNFDISADDSKMFTSPGIVSKLFLHKIDSTSKLVQRNSSADLGRLALFRFHPSGEFGIFTLANDGSSQGSIGTVSTSGASPEWSVVEEITQHADMNLSFSNDIAYSPNGEFAFISFSGRIASYRVNTAEKKIIYLSHIRTENLGGIQRIKVTADGSKIIAKSWDSNVGNFLLTFNVAADGSLTLQYSTPVAVGVVSHGAVGMAVHPNDTFVYVPHRHESKISAFKLNSDGSYTLINSVDIQIPVPLQIIESEVDVAFDLAVSPDGKYLYASLDCEKAWGVYSISPTDGSLSSLRYTRSLINGLESPYYIKFNSAGTHLYAYQFYSQAAVTTTNVNYNYSAVLTFKYNSADGTLTPLQDTIEAFY